jgi:hypothetical protein
MDEETIWELEGDELRYCAAEYDPDLVAALKRRIPPEDRAWDEVARVWRIAACWTRTVRRLHLEHTGENLGLPRRSG